MTDNAPSTPRFFVAHMQKTAGTTLRDRLRATFPEDQIYPNGSDGDDPRVSVISVRHLQERWAVRGDQIRLLTGHFPVRTIELLDCPDQWVTMTIFRDPVERVLSFLRHQAARRQRGATEDTPIEEIYADPFRFEAMIRNHMTRTMSLAPEEWGPGDGVLASVTYDDERLAMAKEAVANLDLFGLQHRIDELCDELRARYGLEVGEPRRSNTTEAYEVPQSFRDRIAEDNALDVALYEYACDLYEQRHPQAG
ncbi:MAG: hypothetical protein KDB02_09150 [Acidimicrobiales bacterium]|nr:hypothetical protein [Acidimicrobiales bacterium]